MVHRLQYVAPMLGTRKLKALMTLLVLAAACVGDGGNEDGNDIAENSVTALPRQGYASPSIPSKYSPYIKETVSGNWTLRVFSSIETAGVHLSSTTVDTSIKQLRLWYRPLGTSRWQRGQDFTGQITKTIATSSSVSHQPLELYVSSLFGLAADSDYEAKVELLNGSNQIVNTLTRSFRTQPDEHGFTPTQTLTVDKTAGPYTTIQSAINAATPGTRIRVKPGVYREALSFPKSGGPNGQWIQLLADGPGVVLDGSYANNADVVTGSWTQYSNSSAEWGGNLWRNNVAGNLHAIWMGDVSLFRHIDTSYTPSGMSAFLNASSGHLNDGCQCADKCYERKDEEQADPYGNDLTGTPKHRVPEGFYTESGKIYLRLASGKTPQEQSFKISKHPVGIKLDGVDWIWIEGLTIRYFGNASSFTGAVRIDNGSFNVIRNNVLVPNRNGVVVNWIDSDSDKRADDGGAYNRIEYNQISTNIRYSNTPAQNYLSYCQTKKGAGFTAVQIGGSVGNIVRGNTVERIGENSIQLQISSANQSHLDGCSDEKACKDLYPYLLYETDVYDNELTNNVEGIELDGGQVLNARVFRNRLFNFELYLLSLQAGQYGPSWLIGNEWIRPANTPYVRADTLKYRLYERHRYVRFYHNTLANFKAGQGVYNRKNLYKYTPTIFRNNLFYGNGTAAKFIDDLEADETAFRGKPDMNYDSYDSESSTVVKWQESDGDTVSLTSIAQLTNYGVEVNGAFRESGFLDAASFDLRLAASSANLDAGVLLPGINDGYLGNAPDVGAHEHGSVEPEPDEIILDDGDPGTSAVGGWSVSSAPDPWGEGSLYAKGEGKTYTFTFELDGTYEVYAWWTAWPSRAANVPITVFHSGGIETVSVNQQLGGGAWYLLGTYTFSTQNGTSGVRVSTTGTLATESVCADAVRLVPVP